MTLTRGLLSINLHLVLRRSTFLVPYIHLVIWYFVYDMYAMCESFSLRKLPRETTLLQKWKTFATRKWSFLAHHLLLLGIAYPIAVVSAL